MFDASKIKDKLSQLSGVPIIIDNHYQDALGAIETRLAEVPNLQAANAALTQQVATLTVFKTQVDARQAALKDSVIGLLKAQGKEPSTLELGVVNSASLEQLESIAADLKKDAMAAGHFRCPHCEKEITSLQAGISPAPAGEPGQAKPAAAPRTIHDH